MKLKHLQSLIMNNNVARKRKQYKHFPFKRLPLYIQVEIVQMYIDTL